MKKWFALKPDLDGKWEFPLVHKPKRQPIERNALPFALASYGGQPLGTDPKLDTLHFPDLAQLPDVISLAYSQLSRGILCTESFASILEQMNFSFPTEKYSYEISENGRTRTLYYYHFAGSSYGSIDGKRSEFQAFNFLTGQGRKIPVVEAEANRLDMGDVLVATRLGLTDCFCDLYSFNIKNAPLVASQRLVSHLEQFGITGIAWSPFDIVECP